MVDIAHVETGALTAQAAWTQRRQCALVAQLCQRVGLVHELRKLAGAEELAQGSHNRAYIDQGDRRELVLIADRHALFDDSLHTAQANTQLILDQLANRLGAPVAE